jgi:hypothetical protein
MRHKILAFEMTKLVHLTELEVNAGCRTWVAHSKKNPYMQGSKTN